jgi:hypothetical protein
VGSSAFLARVSTLFLDPGCDLVPGLNLLSPEGCLEVVALSVEGRTLEKSGTSYMLSSTGWGTSGARGKLLKESVWELSLRPVGVSKRVLLGLVKLTSDCAVGMRL